MFDASKTSAVTLPSGAKAEIREFIAGGRAEYVEAPLVNSAARRRAEAAYRIEHPGSPALPEGESDVHAWQHRLIECHVARITDGANVVEEPSKVLAYAVGDLDEHDYRALVDAVVDSREEAKKKSQARSSSGSTASAA